VRYLDGFGSGGTGVDGEDGPAVFTVIAAAAVASVLLKVLWGLLLRSQVGWGVNDVVLACSVALLSSSECVA